MIDRYLDLARKIEAEAASIRSRVSRASAYSQRVMQAEAAALERTARAMRKEIAEAQEDAEAAP